MHQEKYKILETRKSFACTYLARIGPECIAKYSFYRNSNWTLNFHDLILKIMSRKTYNTMFKCKNTTLPLFVDFYSTNRFWVVCIGRQTAMYTEYCFLDNSGYNRKWKNMFENLHMISLNYKSNFCFSTVIFVINHVPAGRQLNTSTNLFHKRVLYFLLHSS